MIPSPCTNVCRMDAQSGLCVGCYRSLAEIADWQKLDDAARSRVLAAVAQRRTGEEGRAPRPQETRHG